MKKFVLFALLIVHLNAFSQSLKPAPDPTNECPDGYCPGIEIFIETFNLHKPRTQCNRGFGFCLRIKAGITCIPCYGKSLLDEEKIQLFGFLQKDMLTLHIPKALEQINEFSEAGVLDVFEVEENSISLEFPNQSVRYLKAGSYPVNYENNEIVIRIPVE